MKAALSATCGDNSEEDPPVPIPNTVVKLLSADDTRRVTSREIRTSPLFYFLKQRAWALFVLLQHVQKLVQTNLHKILTFIMYLDTGFGKIVSALWAEALPRPKSKFVNKLFLVLERERI